MAILPIKALSLSIVLLFDMTGSVIGATNKRFFND